MTSARAWQDKRQSIESKFATCTTQCITKHKADQLCKDSLEAVIADIWNLKDWLASDERAGLTRTDINAFLDPPGAFNLGGYGDVATWKPSANI